MDRFIGAVVMSFTYLFVFLKSNMDRFIVINTTNIVVSNAILKSNMDRFIDLVPSPSRGGKAF